MQPAYVGVLAACALGALVPQLAAAQTAATAPAPIAFDVIVVRALERAGTVAPACRHLQQRLPMRFGTCSMVKRSQFKLSFGQAGEMKLPTGREVRFLPISIVSETLHLQLEMPGVVNTRLRMTSGSPVILGGERLDGGQLIIQMTPRFSPRRAAPGRQPGSLPAVERVRSLK